MILRRKPHEGWFYTVSEECGSHFSNHVIERTEEQNARASNQTNTSSVNRSSRSVQFLFDAYNFKEHRGDLPIRAQDFAVDLEWSDVLTAIERFAAHGDREAQCLKAALPQDAEPQPRQPINWLAIATTNSGYTIDCYPAELEAYRRQYGAAIIGEFPTLDEAMARVSAVMRHRCDELNAAAR